MRFRSKPLAALSIVLILAGTLGGWHAPDDGDDAIPTAHHHSDHDARFATQTNPAAPEHCALCHWLRAFGSGAPVAAQTLASGSFQFVRISGLVEHVRNTSRITLPSRAPPLA